MKGKLLFVTEDQIPIQNCLFTHRYKSLNGTYSVPSFNTNWSAKIAKVHYTIPFLQKGTCQTDND